MKIGSLCSGYEGLGMAVHAVLGGDLAWVADNDPGAAAILAHRFPSVPNLGDITAVDWSAVEPVDVLTAGFPCQDVSCAGARKGLRAGNRTGVWSHVAEAIGALRPPLVMLENVRGLLTFGADSNLEPCPWCMGDSGDESALRACGAVLADLADVGFDAEWALVSAADVGAPHRRERVFVLAWPAADAEFPTQAGLGECRPLLPASRIQGPRRCGSGTRRPETPAEDPDRATGGEWREPAPGQASGRRPRADVGGSGGALAADAGRSRLGQYPGESPPQEAGTLAGDEPASDRGLRLAAEWGPYGPAVTRWERATGRPASRPTEPGRTGERLSPRFVEWMMGLPEGWVTDIPGLARNAQLKALGNGVVPQQAALALRLLLDRAGIVTEAGEAA